MTFHPRHKWRGIHVIFFINTQTLIGGLCPADRFFEIQHDLKHTLKKGVEENALELALRGRPW
jgi:hypothetical protein